MIALAVVVTLLRELLRAAGTPLRLLCYLPFRRVWRQRAEQALQQARQTDQADGDATQLLAALALHRRPARGTPHVFVSAGEASGEAHAVRVLAALRDVHWRWSAFGGQPLSAAGARLLFPLSEHAAMGFVAVLQQLPQVISAYAAFLRLLRDDPPDLVLLVDYPGLHVVMAKACKRAKVPVLHYVAPQYWAWGPWRMRRYRRSVDATLTILPFETAFFRRFGVPAHYIGHPLLDELQRVQADPQQLEAIRARPTLCLLPGSRRADIASNLPGMLRVAAVLRTSEPGLRVVLPHKDHRRTPLIRELLAAHGADFVEHHEGALAPWLGGSRLVLAKSGTGSLEACLHGQPVVVVYQLRGLLGTLGYHNILSVPFIAAANLIAGRRVVPEFCFHHGGGWDHVLAAVRELWADGNARDQCLAGLREVRQRLGAPGASERVAALLRAFLQDGAAS